MMTIENAELSLQDVIGLLRPFVEARESEAIYGRQKDRYGKLIKHYLETPSTALVKTLYDGEHHIEARLQVRQGAPAYDLLSIHKSDPGLFERLLLTGCLKVDAAAVKLQGAQVAGVEAYASLPPETWALIVEVKK